MIREALRITAGTCGVLYLLGRWIDYWNHQSFVAWFSIGIGVPVAIILIVFRAIERK